MSNRCPHCGAILDPEDDFLEQVPQSNRECIRNVLVDVLADGQIPESDFLLRPFEDGVDALVLEFRKLEGKSHLDADLTSKIIAAIRAAYEDEDNWQFNKTTSPTRPVIACIVAQGHKNQDQATARSSWAEDIALSQQAWAKRQVQAEKRDPWWEKKLNEMQWQMDGAVFDAWLRDTSLLGRDGKRIVVGVRNERAREWLDKHLRPIIERVVAVDGITDVKFEAIEKRSDDDIQDGGPLA